MLLRRFLLFAIIAVPGAAILWAYMASEGLLGQRQDIGEITQRSRNAAVQQAEQQRQLQSTRSLPAYATAQQKQILFGDLHVHSTYSYDAYNISLPMYQGEGSHPPGDACDFARYCSGLDFWSINDHAESLTPRQWSLTKEMVRQCNAAAGDPANPDMVTFLGWEWTQTAQLAKNHYGHKNVVFRDTAERDVPTRPIAAAEIIHPEGVALYIARMRLMLIAGIPNGDVRLLFDKLRRWLQGEDVQLFPDSATRQRYYNFIRYLQDQEEIVACPHGPPVRDLPIKCQESAPTPPELFAKLDDWGFPHLTIPHGNSWGFYTPPLSTWDKQLAGDSDPERQEPLIEIFSGHGNAEQYRRWRAVGVDANGNSYCPEPTAEFLADCWRAGDIIRERCLELGESAEECERRALETRNNYLLTKDSGHWIIPGQTVEDWLDAGQCRDCYMAPYNHRPASSVQYGLAIRNFADETRPPKRFRWGIIGASDSHYARAGTGYKEMMRRTMTDSAVAQLGAQTFVSATERLPYFVPLQKADGRSGPYFARQSSFFGTGGLVAVHAQGRDRGAIWEALERKEVYATSGDRMLLWFNLVEPDEQRLPMGSIVQRDTAPVFEVSALGAFEQKPGCPADSVRALSEDRLQRLCGGECYHPGDRRKPIDRIEVIRIRPQIAAAEDVATLIDDPWLSLPCEGDGEGCTVRFSDPEFAAAQRDAVYYVRALQTPSPTINGANLRCEYDDAGQCIRVDPCPVIAATETTDDCLADAQERAWSSPIFVDFGDPDR
ncbi:MAG: DUF3604 domain-containing protein [Halioglobus sp.]|nr:DUF3604 domain-containing protein [Halioglobus sp.]